MYKKLMLKSRTYQSQSVSISPARRTMAGDTAWLPPAGRTLSAFHQGRAGKDRKGEKGTALHQQPLLEAYRRVCRVWGKDEGNGGYRR